MKVNINNRSIYMDRYLKNNLDLIKKKIKKDWDFCIIIDGLERSGKSVLAQQIGGYLDNNLSIQNITFNPEEFKKAVENANKYDVIIFDEAYSINSRSAMSQVNKTINSLMAQIGQKNLFLIVVLPAYHELDKYLALHRSIVLLHVYADNFERGYFSFFNRQKKKMLYFLGKKFYTYPVNPNFRGRFLKGYFVNEKEYRKKKLDSLTDPKTFNQMPYLEQRNSLIKVCFSRGWTHQDIADCLSIHSKTTLTREAITKVLNKKE